MSDDSTAGWTPPQQPESAGGDVPVPPAPPTIDTPPALGTPATPPPPPTLPPVSGASPPPPPPPPGWSPESGGGGSGDGSDSGGGSDESDGSGKSKKVLIGAVVGVLAIGAAGVFAVTQMSGGDKGGAASPEELGDAVMESLDQEDFLGVIDLLLPGERDTFSEPAQELVSELTRLEVLSEDASLTDLAGFDVALEDRSVLVQGTNVDDIVNITMTADATATINGEELPLGQVITDAIGDADLGELDTTESGLDFVFPVTAVEKDGRWYMSAFYSTAEEGRASANLGDIPETGIEPQGADTPEGAVDALLAGVGQLDLTAIIASLNPNEAEALQRYAPLFIDEPQSELDQIPLSLTVSDVEYDVEGDGNSRSVAVKSIRIEGQIEESGEEMTFSVEYADGCVKAEADGETFDSCVLQGDDDDLDQVLGEIDGLEEFRSTFEDILADYDQPGITVKEVDGEWYVSPIATWFDQFFAITHALDRDEIDRAVQAIEDIATSAEDMFYDEYSDVTGDFEDVPATTYPSDDTITSDTVLGETDDTTPVDSVSDDGLDEEEALYQECWASTTAEEAAGCLQGYIDSGQLPDYYMPIELKHLECGVGDVTLGVVSEYELSDEEYTALLVKANECFVALVASGEVEDYEVPAEYMRPECAESRNPWNFEAPDNQELFDRWLDCIYAE